MAVEIRVLSYNVRSLRDDAAAVATVIRACAPDIACVQEAPRFLRWRSKCAALARDSGLVVVTGGRPAAAMLLLCSLRAAVVSTRDVVLSRKRGLHRRGIALATFAVGGARFAVGSIHLDLEGTERLKHAGEVLEHAAPFGVPTILAGDVNEEPSGPAWQLLAQRLVDAYAAAPLGGGHTYSAKEPVKRIDGIFVDTSIDVVECGVPAVPGLEHAIEAASDHRPVLAVLRIPEAAVDSSERS